MNSTNSIKPNIIIVDDHPIFRQGLKSILMAENLANIIGEASNGIELLQLLTELKPDLVLLDIDMPQMNGMEAAEKAMALCPDLKIIAFTMFSDEDYYYKMIDRGVKGFILKTCGISEIENAIYKVMMNESYFSNELLRKIIRNFRRKDEVKQTNKNMITDRELEVLHQICFGLNTDEIALKLFISPKTVKTHRSNLLEKTESKNTPELIFFALKNKIIEL